MTPVPAPPVPATPSPADVGDLLFARQPILDRHLRLWGYELLFRGGNAAATQRTGAAQASATVITQAFTELSVGTALGPYAACINIDAELLFSDAIELLPARAVVLELLETVTITPALVARIGVLRAQGYRFALDDVVQLDAAHEPLLPLVEIVKVDLRQAPPRTWASLCSHIHEHRLLALAEKVEDEGEAQRCLADGYDLFQGYFFARPTLVSGKRLDHSQLSLMRLLRLLLADADTSQLEQIFREEPGLSLNLLRLTNSAAAGLPVRVTSLRHAITFLGRRQLQRWMQLLMFAAHEGPLGSGALLQLAATRGRLMELLAMRGRPADGAFADQALLCGILSLTPALLQLPIAGIVQGLELEESLRTALVDGAGALGAMLQLCVALEAVSPPPAAELAALVTRAGFVALPPGTLGALLSQALGWANRLGV